MADDDTTWKADLTDALTTAHKERLGWQYSEVVGRFKMIDEKYQDAKIRAQEYQTAALKYDQLSRDLIELQPIGDTDDGDLMQAPRALLVRIIRARMEEIFEMVRRSTAATDAGRLAGGAVVFQRVAS